MAFQTVKDATQLQKLGEAGLLWYRSASGWRTSTYDPTEWKRMLPHELARFVEWGSYAILLEE